MKALFNEVAKREIGEKMIVFGRAAKRWDEYYTLRKDVKGLVIANKL